MANFMKNLSRDAREYIEMDLLDEYEEAERKRVKAVISREDARNLRDQALSIKQQSKTVNKLLDDLGIDEATKKSKLDEWNKAKLKEFGIDIP